MSSRLAALWVALACLVPAAASAQESKGGAGPPIILLPPEPASQPDEGGGAPLSPPPVDGATPTSDFVVGTLPAFDSDAVGTLDPAAHGLGAEPWAGSERSLIETLLVRMPAATGSRVLDDLARRLLLSSGEPPRGPGLGSFLALRAEALARMGNYAAAADLLRAAPGRPDDEVSARLEAEAQLLAGASERACETVRMAAAGYDGPFWRKALIYCQAVGGQMDAAQLGLNLMIEEGGEDEIFAVLMRGLSGMPLPDDMTFSRIEPLHFALLLANARPITAAMVDTFDSALLAVAVRSGGLNEETRLAAAERAETLGVLDSSELAEIYSQIAFSDEEYGNSVSFAEHLGGPLARALFYQVGLKHKVDVARAEILAAMWKLAREDGVFSSAARVSKPVLAEIDPAPELAWFAADASRAALAAGDEDTARAWYRLAETESVRLPMAREAWLNLWPLAVVAGITLGTDRDNLSQWWLSMAQWPDLERRERAIRVLVLFDALAIGVPDSYWSELIAGPARVSMIVPSPPVWHSFARAAANLRVGEAILFSRLIVGAASSEPMSEGVLSAVVSSLRTIGLQSDARALAIEAALAAGF